LLGAQNIHHMDTGPFTGEISASMVKSCGCKIVELGHAERFKYFNENNININKKIILALKYNLIPLVCIGENKMIPSINLRKTHLINKIRIFLRNISIKKNQNIILAYEPIWAIGKSKSANVKYISETIDLIRKYSLKKLKINKNQLHIIYGGSVNNNNARKILEINNLNGVFIGRSAIKANNFINICKNS
jgi:triosephosphate isomerase